MNKIDKIINLRRKKARFYNEKLSKIKGIKIPTELENHYQVYQMYTIQLENEEQREKIQQDLTKAGVMTKVYFEPIHLKTFYIKKFNEDGDFPNDFIDNGDGTISDRVTGLMWGKECSSKLYQYYRAEKYISGLNNKEFAGYNDWRIPTLVELCSLLERRKNEKGLHINPLFDDKQSLYLNLDRPGGMHYMESCAIYHAIDFKTGVISEVATKYQNWCHTQSFYVKAVRTTK